MSKPIHLSIILPFYNSAERVPFALAEFDRYLSVQPHSYEVLLVSDGSSDRTAEIASRMAVGVKNLKVVANPLPQGIGGTVRQGMLVSRGAYRISVDSRYDITPEHVGAILAGLEAGADVVYGSRVVSGSIALHDEGSWAGKASGAIRGLLAWVSHRLTGTRDHRSGFMGFRAEAAEAVFQKSQLNSESFDAEIIALSRGLGLKIGEVPVSWSPNLDSRRVPASPLKNFMERARIYLRLWAGKYATGTK